jgi:N,N'-diacetyllegionaminate synthase
MKIGHKYIGDNYPCFITFEAGATHDGLEYAKKLVKLSAESGADAVKFQIFDPDELIADKTINFEFDILLNKETNQTKRISENLYDIFVRRSLTLNQWAELKQYSDSLGLTFFATIGDELGLDFVKNVGCHSIKIASADVNYFPFLKEVAKTNISIQLDTGNSTIGEIAEAIDIIKAEGNEKIIIHNCPSGYPAKTSSINLRMISSMKSLFNCPIAYSDHSVGFDMDIAAVAVGANLLEKTITLDRATPRVEHIMSLEPKDMKIFINKIREIEIAMGSTRRIFSDEEKYNRLKVRRSIYAGSDYKKGTNVKNMKLKYKRPGYGIPPNKLDEIIDKTLTRDVKNNELLLLNYFE